MKRSPFLASLFDSIGINPSVIIVKRNNVESIGLTKLGESQCEDMIQQYVQSLPRDRRPTVPAGTSVKEQEDPVLISYNEYIKRNEIKDLLNYKRFIGRGHQLNLLQDFLKNSDKKIAVITGDGGIGKTTLSLEFSKKVQNDETSEQWNVLFIPPFKESIFIKN
jgi:ATP-dependent Clp protease ATP-binding subunit ClpA